MIACRGEPRMIQPARKYAVAAMVPTASQRIIVRPRRIIVVTPMDDPTRASRRAPERCKNILNFCQKHNCGCEES